MSMLQEEDSPDVMILDIDDKLVKESPLASKTKKSKRSTSATATATMSMLQEEDSPDVMISKEDDAIGDDSILEKDDGTKKSQCDTDSSGEDFNECYFETKKVALSSEKKEQTTEHASTSTRQAMGSAAHEDTEREMNKYFDLQYKKAERQKVCSDRVKDVIFGEKRISVVYAAHGGIGVSLSVAPAVPIKLIFDFICANMEPDILPPKFCLVNDDDKLEYRTTDNITCLDVPDVLFIKEENYEMNETLTNYDEVFFPEHEDENP